MIILILISLVSIIMCNYIAKVRGLRRVYWSLIGAILGPFALIFIFFDQNKVQYKNNQ